MTKRLLILFVTVCLTLFVGYKTFAMDAVQAGGNPAISSESASSNADMSASPAAASVDSSEDKNMDNSYYYRHGHNHYDHYHRHYWGPGAGGAMLFMLITMMVIFIALA